VKPRIGEIYQERYRIISELGAGGMGFVYRAEQIDANREVALKLLHSDKIEDQETVARFYREFKNLSQLSHPNIMTLYGLALDDESVPFAICEYLDGVSLRSLLAAGPLPCQRALKITIQICHAMQYAHEQGILHRDLKPDNVIIMQRPEPDFVKLVDFGLSRALQTISDPQKLTATGTLVGSPQYMSPEQITGKAVPQSDIYALGCLLFELLSGKALFEGDSPAAVVYRQINESPSMRLRVLESGVSARLLLIISKMLQKDPDQRYQSMAEVASELEAVLEDPLSKAPDASSFQHGKMWQIISLSIVGLAAVALLVMVVWPHNQTAAFQKVVPAKSASKLSVHITGRRLIAHAQQLIAGGNISAAIDLLKKALKNSEREGSDPYQLYDEHVELASAYESKGDLALSAKEWQAAIDIFPFGGSPKRILAGCGLARIFDRLGDTKKAGDIYLQFIHDSEQSGNVAANSIISACDEYVKFLLEHGESEQAYKWAQRALHYSDQCVHGSSTESAHDRATTEAVQCSWIFFDICRDMGHEAEGRRELEKTKSQLRSTGVRDDFTVAAITAFGDNARQHGFDDEAKEMYELAMKDCSLMSTLVGKKIQGNLTQVLSEMKKEKNAHR